MRILAVTSVCGTIGFQCMAADRGTNSESPPALPENVPRYVLAYIACMDGLVRATIKYEHPDLKEKLYSSETIAALRKWLGTDAAWDDEQLGLTDGVLRHLRGQIAPDDTPVVRTFLMHPNQFVRRAAYEVLITEYFAKKEHRDALLVLLQQMFMDASSYVKRSAVSNIRAAKAEKDLAFVLRRWHDSATVDEKKGETYELVSRMLVKLEEDRRTE